jgi:hypothetical protein
MPGKPKTKKARHDRNITGLRNQLRNSPLHSDGTPQSTPPRSQAQTPDLSDLEEDENLEFFNHFDSLKADFQHAEECQDSEEEDEMDEMDELLELGAKDLTDEMLELLIESDDESDDLDWVPEKLRKKTENRKHKNAKRQL